MDAQPFEISIPQADLDDLQDRLRRARWPGELSGVGWDRGVPLDYLKALAGSWRCEFDWRVWEARLNAYPQFTATIEGQPFHVLHARSAEPGALPLLLLHGWPSSFVEFVQLLDPLTDPVKYGGEPNDAFHVVVPSIPGFGFSTPVRETGWASGRIARTCVQLMRSLGYDRYGAHGGDIGAGIAAGLSANDPAGVAGIHVTSDPAAAVSFLMFTGDPAATPGLFEAERTRVEQLKRASTDGMGYLQLQTTRPQTLAYALTDSPVGQLAWIVEKFKEWTAAEATLPEQAVDRDHLLANVSLYWFTRSGASAAHALYESMHAQDWSEPGPAPIGWAVFGADGLVRRLVDPEHKIEHWSEFDQGGHFPAMEAPQLLVDDLRRFFRPLR
jgi:pimeloyl-ACP methyl ester carboxylesterase